MVLDVLVHAKVLNLFFLKQIPCHSVFAISIAEVQHDLPFCDYRPIF